MHDLRMSSTRLQHLAITRMTSWIFSINTYTLSAKIQIKEIFLLETLVYLFIIRHFHVLMTLSSFDLLICF